VRECLNIIKNLKNEAKLKKAFWTQRVYQDILKTQRLIGQEKSETRANGHRKIPKATKKMGFSPVESPILLLDKSVGADTNRSP
jgi:hypothetical protein